MPKGGARINSGPAPDPNALRRDRKSDQEGWTDLPAGGRPGQAPVFPLSLPSTDVDGVRVQDVAAADRETVLWSEIWATPQAVAWERLGWTLEVGLYVRLMVAAEAGDVGAARELRQWSDRLGLNPAAMMRNRWRIARDQVSERRDSAVRASAAAKSSMKDRLKALDGGA